MVHLPIFLIYSVFTSLLLTGELVVSLTKKVSWDSLTLSTKVWTSIVFSVSSGENPTITSTGR